MNVLSQVECAVHAARLANADGIITEPAVWQPSEARALSAKYGFAGEVVETEAPMETALAYSSFERLPLVIANSDRGIRSIAERRIPVVSVVENLESCAVDRLIFFPENNQELLDMVLHAFRLCGDEKVLLPAVIFSGKTVREDVMLPNEKAVKRYMQKLKLPHPIEKGLPYISKPEHMRAAAVGAIPVYEKIAELWKKKFNRPAGPVEYFKTDDAEKVIITAGQDSGVVRSTVLQLRAEGVSVGMVRLRIIRPLPDLSALKGMKIIVIGSAALCAMLKPYYSGVFTTTRPISKNDVIEALKSERAEPAWVE